MMSTDTDYAQHQVDTIRSNLDLLQSNIKALGQFIPEKKIRADIANWRLCVTTPRRHYPKTPVLFSEMGRFDIKALLGLLITLPPSHQDLQDYLQRFRDLLEFPQQYYDNYDDMFPPVDEQGQRMLSEVGFRDMQLKKLQDEEAPEMANIVGVSEQPFVDMESKRFKKEYKKYVEEWREKYVKKDWREESND